jgi:2-(1,2-epoxy-1,2-dihydrophenyl)acetyl-CoA isomerase
LLHESASASIDQQLANEALALELSSRTDDFREGLAAFKEKRRPDFEGR